MGRFLSGLSAVALAVGLGLDIPAAAAAPRSAPAASSAPAVTGASGTLPSAIRVSMKDFAFSPATITIRAGQAVTWTYDESATDLQPNCEAPEFQIPGSPVSCPGHSTTAHASGPDGKPLWDSGVHRAPGFPYSARFNTPGTYTYFCVVHGGAHPNNPITHMDGTIIVLPAAATPAAPVPAPPPSNAGTGGSGTPNAAASPPSTSPTLPATGRSPFVGWGLAALALGGALVLARRAVTRSGAGVASKPAAPAVAGPTAGGS